MKIHPTAIIDPKTELADDVEVQPYSIIEGGVRIGAGTVVGPHCVITGRTIIGKNNRLFSGAQIGVLSQDLKHAPGLTGRCVIGDGNMFREYVTVSASSMTGPEDEDHVTSIGDNCLFMAYSHVAHDCHVGNSVWMANCAALAGHVDVEDKAIIGGLTGIHQECRVGTLAMVGGMTRLTMDAPPYVIVAGNPGQCHGPNAVGLKRNGYDEAARGRIKTMYRIMFRSDLNTAQALERIEEVVDESEERTHFLKFVRESKRGITR